MLLIQSLDSAKVIVELCQITYIISMKIIRLITRSALEIEMIIQFSLTLVVQSDM